MPTVAILLRTGPIDFPNLSDRGYTVLMMTMKIGQIEDLIESDLGKQADRYVTRILVSEATARFFEDGSLVLKQSDSTDCFAIKPGQVIAAMTEDEHDDWEMNLHYCPACDDFTVEYYDMGIGPYSPINWKKYRCTKCGWSRKVNFA